MGTLVFVVILRDLPGSFCCQEATYFEIVEKARSLLTDDDWWVAAS